MPICPHWVDRKFPAQPEVRFDGAGRAFTNSLQPRKVDHAIQAVFHTAITETCFFDLPPESLAKEFPINNPDQIQFLRAWHYLVPLWLCLRRHADTHAH